MSEGSVRLTDEWEVIDGKVEGSASTSAQTTDNVTEMGSYMKYAAFGTAESIADSGQVTVTFEEYDGSSWSDISNATATVTNDSGGTLDTEAVVELYDRDISLDTTQIRAYVDKDSSSVGAITLIGYKQRSGNVSNPDDGTNVSS